MERRSVVLRIFYGIVPALLALSPALAAKLNDVGVTDTEIKIGNVAPYSGPGSAYSVIAKTQAAYFRMINAQGGIDGRRINFISYDDAFSPPKTVEQVRKLVESDEVFAIFQLLGTAGNSAVAGYLNRKQVPHIFIGSGASKWADPARYPWSMGIQPRLKDEAKLYASYILKHFPGKTLGMLYQNDDFGKEYLAGFHEGFGNSYSKIVVAEVPYELTAPTVDSLVTRIKDAGPDIYFAATTAKFAAQSLRRVGELNWKPIKFVSYNTVSISAILKPAGLQNAQGLITTAYLKDPGDPQWKNDPAMNDWRAFMAKWYPGGDQRDADVIYGYAAAEALVKVLRLCGDNMTRANLMKQMSHMDFDVSVFLPGIRVKTTATNRAPINELQIVKFEGEAWKAFGPVMQIDGNPDPN